MKEQPAPHAPETQPEIRSVEQLIMVYKALRKAATDISGSQHERFVAAMHAIADFQAATTPELEQASRPQLATAFAGIGITLTPDEPRSKF